ncbi:PIR protein [Plasmodium ovale]|uniref:PIR protein n=1 Tax=Plasmodium ovale TaxID=36330 RepID=A0A1C3KEN2_PLAOA|nr:PIR protein [Plasmodium ovale]
MPCEEGTDKYKFCLNSNYYKVLLKYAKVNKSEVDKGQKCDNLSTSMGLSESINVKDICQEFKALYKAFSIYSGKKNPQDDIFSSYDCDFLNYWLNDKLRENISDNSNHIKMFYEKMREQDNDFFSNANDLEKYLNVIDPDILENMKLLYKLYDNAVIIINMMRGQDYPDEKQEEEEQEKVEKEKEEKKSCSEYTKECDDNYKKAMDRCFNSNDDFYKALKFFNRSYKIITEQSSNESNACNSIKFSFFPVYDPVPEKEKKQEKEKEKRIMTIKISSILSVLSLTLPLIYKFTPFGPFLRGKINMVRNRWFNPDENGEELLPLSTDIEDNISNYGEYNIGYYSETN